MGKRKFWNYTKRSNLRNFVTSPYNSLVAIVMLILVSLDYWCLTFIFWLLRLSLLFILDSDWWPCFYTHYHFWLYFFLPKINWFWINMLDKRAKCMPDLELINLSLESYAFLPSFSKKINFTHKLLWIKRV